MYDPLATRRGRLLTFFLLYVTEGIPLGLNATAIATQMRRQGVGPAAIGAFVASLYLPWAWKWLAGPVVDTVYSHRLGKRRAWIVACQCAMVFTLLAAVQVDFVTRLKWFTWIIFVHNIFAATMDVAIDALAVSVLKEDERGSANGLMFAGAYLGNALGGAGVLFVMEYIGLEVSFWLVAIAISAIALLVSLWLRERAPVIALAASGPASRDLLAELWAYVRTAARAMFGSQPAIAGLAFALLPAGAYALSLALQSNLAVELGFSDRRIALLALGSTVLSAAGCVVGGLLSDRFGRRRMIALYIAVHVLPALAMAVAMTSHHWVMPVDPKAAVKPLAPAALVAVFWAATLVHAFVHGLMYGTRTALFMDICTPAVAATQFTAYMAILNFVIAYSAWWQGWAVEKFGYPITLSLDATLGMLCLVALPFMTPRPVGADSGYRGGGFPLSSGDHG